MQPALQFEIEQCLAIMQTMIRVAEDLGQTELKKSLQERMDLYYSLYVGQPYNP